jgi:hypothetical protein
VRKRLAVAGRQRLVRRSDMLTFVGADMFNIYLNDRRDLVIVRKGFPIPVAHTSGRWRKRNKQVLSVSEEIRLAIQSRGYYMRKLRDLKNS